MEALKTLFLESTLPCWAIFGMLLVATVLAQFSYGWPAILAPILLLAAIVIELFGLMKCGTNMLWWLDGAGFSSLGGILRMLLFSLAVTMQVGSIYIFGKKLSGGDLRGLSIWRPVLSILIGAVVAVIVIFVCGIFHVDQHSVFYVGLVAFFIVLAIGLVRSFSENCDTLDVFPGILFTVFVVIWGIGSVAALILLVVSLSKALPVVAVVVAFGLVVFFMNRAGLFDDEYDFIEDVDLRNRLKSERRARQEAEARAKAAQKRREDEALAIKRKQEAENKQLERQAHINKYGW